MRAQGSGTIIQISSMGGQVTGAGGSAYAAAKFALEGLSEAVAAEVAPFNIRVLIRSLGGHRAHDRFRHVTRHRTTRRPAPGPIG
jgi:NAD(P)-dependent dehydrogenase (short-subunit alcohol dehydrogenase family)